MIIMSKFNPYQVICIGDNCRLYDKCQDKCILKSKLKNYLKGCNYSKDGDCQYCSYKKKCVLIKPYSDKLYEVELKRHRLENENDELYKLISEWDGIENNLEEYGVGSVFDVINFKRNKQQMIDRINDNKKLIKAYLKKEYDLIGELYANKD